MTITQNTNYLGGCDFGFTGHFTRTALVAGRTELVLTHFRVYDPELGRWLSEDPIERVTGRASETQPGESNLNGYVGGDPVSSVDRFGLDRWLVSDMGGAHMGVVFEDPTSNTGYRRFDMAITGLTVSEAMCPGNEFYRIQSSREQDREAIAFIRKGDVGDPARLTGWPYNIFTDNCRHYANFFCTLGLEDRVSATEMIAIYIPITSKTPRAFVRPSNQEGGDDCK